MRFAHKIQGGRGHTSHIVIRLPYFNFAIVCGVINFENYCVHSKITQRDKSYVRDVIVVILSMIHGWYLG